MAGLLTNVRNRMYSLFGAKIPPPVPEPADRTREKVAADQRGVIRPQFLPYLSDVTGETAAHRKAYRQMIADPNIKPALLGKSLAVAALEATFSPASEQDAEAQRHAAFAAWQYTERIAGGIPELAWNILANGLVDGYSVNEPVWEMEVGGDWHAKHVLDELKPKVVDDDVVLLTDEFRNVVGVQGVRYNTGQVWHPSQFVLWRNPGLYGTPTGMSDLRAAYGRYWVLDTATKLRAIGAEKRAFPLLVGHYKDAGDQAGIAAALALVKSSNYMAAPDSARIEAIDIAGTGESYFRDLIKDLREEIIISIQGSMLQMMQGGEGVQRGASSVHKDTADLFKWWLQQALVTVFNRHKGGLIRMVIDPNFANVSRYPKASFGGIDEAELKESLMIDQGLGQLGWQLSRADLARRYGRVWAADENDVVRPAQVQVPAMPFAEPDPGPAVPAPEPFRFAEGWQPADYSWIED